MAFIVNYKPEIHDLYLYPSGPTIDPENYLNNQGVYGTTYNPNLWIKGNCYGFTYIDFSGIGLRFRGAPGYGFDQFVGQPGAQPSGVKINENGSVTFPDIIQTQFFYPPEADAELNCYYPGCPPGNFTKAKNFQYWNNGQWARVLVSPKHFIACTHYVGPGSLEGSVHYFLGKNNQTYQKTAKKIIDLRESHGITYPSGFSYSNFLNNLDLCVFEFNEAFSEAELEQVKPYKFLNSASLIGITNVPAFSVHPQGVVSVRTAFYDKVFYNYNQHGQTAAFTGYINDNDVPVPDIDGQNTVWIGDSGTPVLVYVPSINETCYDALKFTVGSSSVFDQPNSPIPNQVKVFFDSLQKYVSDTIGYTIGLVNYSAVAPYEPPEPNIYPETLNVNGNTYYLAKSIASSTGATTFTTVEKTKLGWYGVTCNFAIISYNKNGFSGYATLDNFYIPPLEVEPPPDL